MVRSFADVANVDSVVWRFDIFQTFFGRTSVVMTICPERVSKIVATLPMVRTEISIFHRPCSFVVP